MTPDHRSDDAVVTMASEDLAATLRREGLWRQDPVPSGAWYVRALQVVAAWLACLMLLPFVGWILLAVIDNEQTIPVAAVVMAAVAAVFLRADGSRGFVGQLGSAVGLAAGAVAVAWGWDKPAGWMLPTLIAVGLYIAGGNVSNRLLSGCTLAIGIYMALRPSLGYFLPGSSTAMAILAWGALIAWTLAGSRQWRHGDALVPLAWAFVLAASVLAVLGNDAFLRLDPVMQHTPAYWHPARLACAVLPAGAWGLAWALAAPGTGPGRSLGVAIAVLLLSLIPVWQAAPGVALAIAWLITGFAQSRITLVAIAMLAVLAYLGRYYYQLDVPLLHKSAWLGAAGVLLALVAAVLARWPRRLP